jgi:hypothetical protein
MADTVDRNLVAQYRTMMERESFKGLSVLQHEKVIGDLIEKTDSVYLLDYGCGRAGAYATPHKMHKRWGVPQPELYDPAWVERSFKPDGSFHGVICSDVLEHIPERDLDAVIAELFGYAERFVFASVCCRPAKKHFEDGTNMHVTIHPYSWWREKMAAQAGGRDIQWLLVETP